MDEEKLGVGEKRMNNNRSWNIFKNRCFNSQPNINSVLNGKLQDCQWNADAKEEKIVSNTLFCTL